LLPDMNYSAMRANRWAQQRTADFWRTLIVSIIRPTHRPDVPLQNARARFTRHSSVQPDPAQLGMSFKAIEDAFCRSGWSSGKKKRWIQRAEVLHDDAPRYVTSSFHWAPAPARGGFITIEIDEIEGEGHVD
jgi:hypothetical protein